MDDEARAKEFRRRLGVLQAASGDARRLRSASKTAVEWHHWDKTLLECAQQIADLHLALMGMQAREEPRQK